VYPAIAHAGHIFLRKRIHPLGAGGSESHGVVACQIDHHNARQLHNMCGLSGSSGFFVYLVDLVSFVQPNKRNRPNKPNNGFLALEDFFSTLFSER
jgi:hypothetical protein